MEKGGNMIGGNLLTGEKVRLRALEPGDVELLHRWENDTRVWNISGTLAPFSRDVLRRFIEEQQYDIYHTRQLRLVICRSMRSGHGDGANGRDYAANDHLGRGDGGDTRSDGAKGVIGERPVGMVDLFEFDPVNLRAGIGLLICDEGDRRQGYASEALELTCRYAERVLGLRQIWCSVGTDNLPCLELFRSTAFVETGIRRAWSRQGNLWRDEIFFQRIFP